MFRFRVGSFPVTVFPSFFFAAAILGWVFTASLQRLLVWIAIVFVSVLVHELGHALVGRSLGGRPEIRLEGFGGLTFPHLRQRPSALRQIGLSLAGPLAGLALGALAWLLGVALPPEPGSWTDDVLRLIKMTSVSWAILNLLPVLPLDGGQVLHAVIEGVRRKPSLRLASWISAAFALAIALASAVLAREPYIAIWFALFAFQNLARARLEAPARAHVAVGGLDAEERAEVEREMERARAALVAQDVEAALAAAASLEQSDAPYRQAAGLRIRAGIELARGNNEAAGLHAGRSYSLWESVDAAVVAARANLRAGQYERAANWLRRALEAGAQAAAVRDDPELGSLQR